MVRARSGAAKHRAKKRLLRAAKGYRGSHSKLLRPARITVERAQAMSYVGRKLKKRDFRSLWITRLSAACRARNLRYSQLIKALVEANISLDRKTLSQLAISDPEAFDAVLAKAGLSVDAKC
ncbi:MAG: 50S ribosomal protein L20 [Actinobacteria bacterium]|nr:50S ribosomal protein L20 [Actinomycetota bacterium]